MDPMDRRTFIPGLDVAVVVRRLHTKGRNIEAIRMLRADLDCSLTEAIEWMTALTGWKPGAAARAASKPGALSELTVESLVTNELRKRIPLMADADLVATYRTIRPS